VNLAERRAASRERSLPDHYRRHLDEPRAIARSGSVKTLAFPALEVIREIPADRNLISTTTV